MECQACGSKRIVYVRHDSDWNGGHDVGIVNKVEDYNELDLDQNGDVETFGDINMYVCLACDYVWQKYGSFKLAYREVCDGRQPIHPLD